MPGAAPIAGSRWGWRKRPDASNRNVGFPCRLPARCPSREPRPFGFRSLRGGESVRASEPHLLILTSRATSLPVERRPLKIPFSRTQKLVLANMGFVNPSWILLWFLLLGFEPPSSGQQKPAPGPRAPKCGPVSEQVFKCPKFGFTFTVPFGWVDRTTAFGQDEVGGGDEDYDAGVQREAEGSQVLLAVFERPPGAPGEGTNSAVVIAAESLASYKGVKSAADYFGPLGNVATRDGFRVVNEPYSFPVGMKQVVRGDFSKESGKALMWQSSLVRIAGSKILLFTFIAGSGEEADLLIQNLRFSTPRRAK
jgi:hypothetical protein